MKIILFLSLFSILVSLLVLVGAGGAVNFLGRRVSEVESKLEGLNAREKQEEEREAILGESHVDEAELLREYKMDNESLRTSTLKYSPSGKYYAFFQHKFVKDVKEIGDEDYAYIVAYLGVREEPVFKSDFRLSSFEWLSDEEVAVYRGCGTECSLAYIVNVKTKKYRELPLGVGYTWSPNRRYVAAYHYSYKYGFSLAEKDDTYGRVKFELRRNHPPSGSGLSSATRLTWSPDSSKFSVILRKENEERLELLVFDVSDGFTLLTARDLENKEFSGLNWRDEKTVVYEDGNQQKVIIL